MAISDAANTPLEPDRSAVERHYGEFAELYALTRAKAAAGLGLRPEALKWFKVEHEIKQAEDDRS